MNSQPNSIPHDDLHQKTVVGVGWASVAQIGRQLVQFLISIVLARLLTPEDFGLLGMILVFTGFVALFAELGFGAALIQREEIGDRHLQSVFWLNLVLGTLLALLFIVAAPAIAGFYQEPILTPLIRMVSLNFPIVSVSIVQRTIMRRDMDFRKVARSELFSVAVGGCLAVVMALTGQGVWSLIWQILATSAAASIAYWWQASWRPRAAYDGAAIRDLWTFSSNLLGFSVINYWSRSADNLLVGRFLGSSALGIYSRAYSTMILPLSQVANVLGQVMFPALSRMQDDKARVKRIYLRSIAMIALVTFPMMVGLFVVAEVFVLALFGPKWSAVTPVLRILCLVGMIQSLVTTVGWIYQSQGRADWQFRWGLVASALGIISFLVGVYLGSVEWVALCYAGLNVVLFYWHFSIPGRLINLKTHEVLAAVANIFGCTLVMGGAVWALGLALPSSWPSWATLLIQSISGVLVYWALISLFKIQAFVSLKQQMPKRWRGKRLSLSHRQ